MDEKDLLIQSLRRKIAEMSEEIAFKDELINSLFKAFESVEKATEVLREISDDFQREISE